jgi:hypothetical protein
MEKERRDKKCATRTCNLAHSRFRTSRFASSATTLHPSLVANPEGNLVYTNSGQLRLDGQQPSGSECVSFGKNGNVPPAFSGEKEGKHYSRLLMLFMVMVLR